MISLTTWLAVLLATAKQMPWAPAITAVLMPITSPREETSGPPELPGLSAASVWITSSISRPVLERSDRPSAETTPAVTVEFEAQGIADRHHELAAPQSLGVAQPRRRQGDVVDDSQQREVGVRIVAQHARLDGARVGQRQPHGGGALHDVAVGEHQAVGRDHDARTGAAALALLAVGRRLDPHDGGADPVDDIDDGLRVGVEQGLFIRGGFCRETGVARQSQLVGDERRLEVEHAPIWGLGRKTSVSCRTRASRRVISLVMLLPPGGEAG